MKCQWDIEELIEHSLGNKRGKRSYALVRPRRMNYCWGKEMQQVLDKQRTYPNAFQITLMILRPVSWKRTGVSYCPYGKLQAEPERE